MMNSHIHQRGSGLFSSVRSSSQTWPVVLSSEPAAPLAPTITLRRAATPSSTRQAIIDTTEATATNTDQPPE